VLERLKCLLEIDEASAVIDI